MRRSNRAFGVAAAAPKELTEPLAIAAETAGFSTFWVNDTPGADGIAVLGRAARVTEQIRLGVGVIPLDRRSAKGIAAAIELCGIAPDRLVVGVGAGGARVGSLELVQTEIEKLRRLTSCRIAIGALGPNMIALSDEIADAVLLNWLTADWVAKSTTSPGYTSPQSSELIGYVRTALPTASGALGREAARYASYPQYARHFERMGVPALSTCILGDEAAIQDGLKAFERHLDETVVRAIVAEESLESYLELLNAAAPNPEVSRAN